MANPRTRTLRSGVYREEVYAPVPWTEGNLPRRPQATPCLTNTNALKRQNAPLAISSVERSAMGNGVDKRRRSIGRGTSGWIILDERPGI